MGRAVATHTGRLRRHRMIAGIAAIAAFAAACIALALPATSMRAFAEDEIGGPRATAKNLIAQAEGQTVTDYLGVTRSELVNWLKSHEEDDYYIGTPYDGRNIGSPKGDPNTYGDGDGTTVGMNCTGFVWHALCAAHQWKDGIAEKCPMMSGWSGLFANYESYYYNSKEDMLKSGKLQKGDIVWCFYIAWTAGGTGGGDNHIGIYWPADDDSTSEDRWWDSVDAGWKSGNFITRGSNAIAEILPKYDSELWVVLKLGDDSSLSLEKASSNPEITDKNDCYSLAGAIYKVYSDKACKKLVGTLTTAEDGSTNVIEGIEPGTYYIKEKKASPGYALDETVHSVQVGEGENVFHATEVPQVAPAGIAVRKSDPDTGKAAASQGAASLKGARFRIRYYDGFYEKKDDLPKKPAKTWVVESTDAEGNVDLDAKGNPVSGDDFFKDDGGKTVFPLGTITIKEIRAPQGYNLDNGTPGTDPELKIRCIRSKSDGEYVKALNTFAAADSVQRGNIELVKGDRDLGRTQAQGAAELAGAVYRIINDNDGMVASPETGELVAKGGVVCTIITDENGFASTAASEANGWEIPTSWNGYALAYGRYLVKEEKAGTGYLVDVAYEGAATIAEQGQTVRLETDDRVQHGDIELAKSDAELARRQAQGAASLEGARYRIVNANSRPVVSPETGREVAPGEVVCTIVTDAEGFASTARADLNGWSAPEEWSASLAYGSYTVEEESASKGYLVNVDSPAAVSIAGQGETARADTTEQVQRGGVMVGKVDREYRECVPLGAATLAGAVFEIVNDGANPVVVGGVEYAPGKAVCAITAEKHDDGRIYAATGPKDLPFGVYTVREKQSSGKGYLLDALSRSWSCTFSISADGEMVDLTDPDRAVANQAIRGDVALTKVREATMGRLAGIPFRITSKTTGEAHVAVTDANGMLSTAADWNAHTQATNANDAADRGDGTADDAKLDASAGIWFYGRTDKQTAVDDKLGALPFDTYTFEELKCAANQDLALVAFDVAVTRDAVVLDLGTIDDGPGPSIATSLADGHDVKMVPATQQAALVDRVAYSNFKPGSYRMEGELHLLGDDGSDERIVATAERAFTVESDGKTASGTVDVAFEADTSLLAGRRIVAVERAYAADAPKGAEPVAAHADLADADQTVTIPAIETTLTDAQNTRHAASPAETVTLTDKVDYKGLDTAKSYTMEATLHMRDAAGNDLGEALDSAGEPIVARQTFTPTEPDGAVYVTFTFERVPVAGKTLVAFEELTHEGIVYAAHARIDDEAQTVTVPDLATTAHDAVLGGHRALADENATIVDSVRYTGFETDAEYTLVATMHLRNADGSDGGPLTSTTGEPIRAEKTFAPEAPDGTVDIEFAFNASKLAGASIVVFEEAYRDGELYAAHADIADQDQTIDFARLSTTASGKQTQSHVLAADADAVIVDTVSYENVAPGEAYMLHATVHARSAEGRDLGPVVRADGSAIEASTEFTAEAADGTVALEIPVDLTGYAGKTLVVFEELFHEGALVGRHADIADDDQAISVAKIATQARDAQSGKQEATPNAESAIADEVAFEGLRPGDAYTLTGTLMDKATGKALVGADGKPIEAAASFTAEQASGTVTMDFALGGIELGGKTIVVFERLEDARGNVVAVHEDIDAAEQSVAYRAPSPAIGTRARDKASGKQAAEAGAKSVVADVVSYRGLEEGRTYTLKGTLMDKATGKALTGADGKPVESERTFTAEAAKGSIEVEFSLADAQIEGKTLVAFEKLFNREGKLVAAHEDISARSQTVAYRAPTPPSKSTAPQTGDPVTGLIAAVGFAGIAALAIGAIATARKHRSERRADRR